MELFVPTFKGTLSLTAPDWGVLISIGILAIRVHALYGLKRYMKYSLAAFWAVTTITSIGMTAHQTIVLSRMHNNSQHCTLRSYDSLKKPSRLFRKSKCVYQRNFRTGTGLSGYVG